MWSFGVSEMYFLKLSVLVESFGHLGCLAPRSGNWVARAHWIMTVWILSTGQRPFTDFYISSRKHEGEWRARSVYGFVKATGVAYFH